MLKSWLLLSFLSALLFSSAWAYPTKRDAVSTDSTPSTDVTDSSQSTDATDATTGTAGTSIPNFPDPSILKVDNRWYAFGTTGNGAHAQIAVSYDFNGWNRMSKDALPHLPSWVNSANPQVWAPDVIRRPDGQYVMYFSASSAQNTKLHCVGTATSSNPEGPYNPSPNPITCPLGQGGAIDASGFKDRDGTMYMVYKVDGNSIGHGGTCNNMNDPIVPTPIMLQKLQADGVTPVGGPTQILDRNSGDGPLVEAPSLVRSSQGIYFLFFSSNCWASTNYDVTWATASNINGPYTKRGPLYVTGKNGLQSPGGMDIDEDGQHMLFHAGPSNARQLYTAKISLDGTNVHG